MVSPAWGAQIHTIAPGMIRSYFIFALVSEEGENLKDYESLYRLYGKQALESVFAHFYPVGADHDAPFRTIAEKTMEGAASWGFTQERFRKKYSNTAYPKLKNYLNYTFKRLLDLEKASPGKHFLLNAAGNWIAFNTGLQNNFGADLLMIFEKYRSNNGQEVRADWVFKGCFAPNEQGYRSRFGTNYPEIAWYSVDSRDYVFDWTYDLESDVFDHLFERAKERAGMPNAADEVVRNYLSGALLNLIPKIKRNYKVAIPVYYVEEKRMQLLLPFVSVHDQNDISCFLVERDDELKAYRIKTIFDLDQAYFSARLITRPDKDWLNP
nr:DUF3825 domain-containing protein [Brucella anthropi]